LVTDEVPRIASTLLLTGLFLPVVLLFDAVLMWPRHPILAPVLIAFAPIACIFIVRDLSTKLSHDGVSQLTWRGRVYLGWNAVGAVRRRTNSIIVYGAAARVVIAFQKFYDSGATVRFIDSQLPRHLRE
jgi:hypothetical protein